MAIVLRFVYKTGHVKKIFFDLMHVKDTMGVTLKREICDVLSRHDLDVSNIRGQGILSNQASRFVIIALEVERITITMPPKI